MGVNPTLFIALGGTGAEIALRLRRRILSHAWGNADNRVTLDSLDQFPLAQFIYYDLDRGSKDVRKNSDHLTDSVAFWESERITQSNYYLDPYYYPEQSCHRNPHIDSWLPVKPEWIKEWINIAEERANNHSSTVQPRFFSRMVFFNEYRRLMHMIQDKLNSLLVGVSNRASLNRIGLDTEAENIRVVVFASTAGGAGSGAFIDMGYLAKQLVKRATVGNSMVDLLLMLPGGYSGHDKTRCEANTYAALMELETCMMPGPGFVKGWNLDEFAELSAKPYDNVFLIDTINMAEKTAEVTDCFDMVADNLFADFCSSEFSSQKRSISVNQLQHTIRPFTLPVNAEKFGNLKMNYLKAYSSIGMAVIDTGLEYLRHEIAREQVGEMLKVFFGVSSDLSSSREITSPTSDDGFDILREQACCGKENFILAYHFVFDDAPFQEGVEICILQLIGTLLYDNDNQSLLSLIRNRKNSKINEILDLSDKDLQLQKVADLLTDVGGGLGASDSIAFTLASVCEEKIKLRRKMIFQKIVDKNSGLFKTLWATVGNKDKGGFNYTFQLINRIKDCIKNDSTGLLRDIDIAQRWFAGLREKLHNGELQVLRERFLQSKEGLLLFKHRREILAEGLLQQMGEAICWYAEARLYEVACKEAAWLLQEISSWLGEYQGLDEQTNRKCWSENGFAGKLAYYEKLVLDIISGVNEKTVRVDDRTKSGHPKVHLVKTSTAELEDAQNLSSGLAMEMAQSVFDNLGGSRDILERLMNNQSSAEIIGQLHNLALSRLPVMGSGDENPLLKALEALDSTVRRDIFQNCLESAMPWIDAHTEGQWTVNPSQYVCLVGVDGAHLFAQRFGEEFKSAIPSRTGLTPKHISFYESGILGKLTCYVELSGLPLTALIQLPNWRESYEEENKRFPVHIHKDRSLFVHPLAPTAATLDRLAEHFKIFIQGIVLGVLKLRRNNSGNLDYCLAVSGEDMSVGNERLIRLDGVVSEVQEMILNKVANVLNQFKAPAQHACLVVLYDFYAQCVYPPAIVRNHSGMESLQESFPHVMCRKLRDEAQKSLEEKYSDEDTDMIVRLIGKDVLQDTLDLWTDEIEGSDSDVYEFEVGRAHKPKRQLKREFYNPGWLERQTDISASNSDDKFCSACSEQLEGTPKFCPNCGVRQNVYAASPPHINADV